MLCYVVLCYVMLCYVMLCYVMLCYVMLCYVMLCYVMLCYVMLCYVMLVQISVFFVFTCTMEIKLYDPKHNIRPQKMQNIRGFRGFALDLNLLGAFGYTQSSSL